MQPGKMHPYCMHWIPCTVIEFSVFQAAWSNGTLLNEVYFMHHDWMQWIPAAWMNAVDFCSMAKWIPSECSGFHAVSLNAVDSMQHDWMQWILQHDWMQWIPCSLVKCIPIECIGFHAAWLNSVYSRQNEAMEPYWMKCILFSMIECSGFLQHEWMQWIFCSMSPSIPIECRGFHAAW